ncbi:MAG: ankyrin repeat domain-containing protein [Holophaga sp.]|jgi:hypothetical protein
MHPANLTDSLQEGIESARQGDLPRLKAWLGQGNDPNQHDRTGWTPLLWASVRGHAEAVQLLLANAGAPADPGLPHRMSGARPVHMAGHGGDVRTCRIVLDRRPDLLDAVLEMNGHTVLLQAVFYGHLDLVRTLLEQGADTAITTARGLGPMELATQFQNLAMMDLIRPFDAPATAKARYYAGFLERIAPVVPPGERAAQALADAFVRLVDDGIREALHTPGKAQDTLLRARAMVEREGVEVNRLAGPLQQPPLIVVATGNNGWPTVPAAAALRLDLADLLLAHGADPIRREIHPMGAQTIIRAAVFNHLDILKRCAAVLAPEILRDAINEIPVINGLTAMHDTVLRATMAAADRFDGYLDQARWFVQKGGRSDLEDFAGSTQRQLAERAKDPVVRQRLLAVLDGRA